MWRGITIKIDISIIVPVFNEEQTIRLFLAHLQPLRERSCELIVVDGGSTDNTIDLIDHSVDIIVRSERGRAKQMNAGAEKAKGSILLFLHADTYLPINADQIIIDSVNNHSEWGRFNIELSGAGLIFKIISFMVNVRSRITSIATGDQAIFITKQLFFQSTRYSEIPLMEDVELSLRLRKISKPVCIKEKVKTSSRRWEKVGVLRTIMTMWWIRLAYHFGVSPYKLAKRYGYEI